MKNRKTITRAALAAIIFVVVALVASRMVGDHGALPAPPQPPHAHAGSAK
ncbi:MULTISPECIES: hypothetical protein [unclassified Thiomonas]|nr:MULTISPECIES: hypothetical protein [unclassified Thiomonas]CDW96333.1 exported hypothetical protein [Thiomonas sp. CB2]VDY06739.1 protein of unknown function [Thiomonas sp. Bio17B3]VDY09967.1 protein of unknown function [Thiomonas sp. Sup16B3]VDY11210.1 protein of unknown function [Thiomonas sp. Sup16B3]VDY11251.1 protein of unknown function [Thiomonas sp. Bio17B3]